MRSFYKINKQRSVDVEFVRRKNSIRNIILCSICFLYTSIQAEILTVGTTIDPPLVYQNEQGELTGATVDLIKEIAARLKIEVSISTAPWRRTLFMAEEGLSDSICCVGLTQDRLKFLYYPKENIATEQNVFFIKKGNSIEIDEKLENFENITIGTIRGYIYASIQNAIENNRFKSVQAVPTIEQNLKKLLSGRTDVFIGNKLVIVYHLKRLGLYHEIEILKKPGTNENWVIDDWPVYWAFSKKKFKNSDFAEQVSHIIKEMKADGTYEKILKNYL